MDSTVMQDRYLVALDIGGTKTCALIARISMKTGPGFEWCRRSRGSRKE
jgi:cell division ATPase FtsA